MDPVRNSDINRTPDIRTRLVVKQWAALVTVSFVVPILNSEAIGTLLSNAGIMQGVGDWRPEKGKGNFGTFELVNANSAAFKKILKSGRKVQEAAMADPECYDKETAELLSWFEETADARGFTRMRRTA